MLSTLHSIDSKLFLFLNGLHSPFWDIVMWNASSILFWFPFYGWLLWLLYRRYTKSFWMVLLSIVLTIALADQAANLAKSGFERLRPSHNPEFIGMVHLLKGYTGGSYGYFSGHAANAFAIAGFISFLIGRSNRTAVTITFIYAAIVSYSRIYLGVHYPGDILTGACVGFIIGFLTATVFKAIKKQ